MRGNLTKKSALCCAAGPVARDDYPRSSFGTSRTAIDGRPASQWAPDRTRRILAPNPGRNRHGQRRATKQSRGEEAQEREDQGHCRRTKPKDRWLAADLEYGQEEIEVIADGSAASL